MLEFWDLDVEARDQERRVRAREEFAEHVRRMERCDPFRGLRRVVEGMECE